MSLGAHAPTTPAPLEGSKGDGLPLSQPLLCCAHSAPCCVGGSPTQCRVSAAQFYLPLLLPLLPVALEAWQAKARLARGPGSTPLTPRLCLCVRTRVLSCSRFDFEGLESADDGAFDKLRAWSRSIEDLQPPSALSAPFTNSLARSARQSVLRYVCVLLCPPPPALARAGLADTA